MSATEKADFSKELRQNYVNQTKLCFAMLRLQKRSRERVEKKYHEFSEFLHGIIKDWCELSGAALGITGATLYSYDLANSHPIDATPIVEFASEPSREQRVFVTAQAQMGVVPGNSSIAGLLLLPDFGKDAYSYIHGQLADLGMPVMCMVKSGWAEWWIRNPAILPKSLKRNTEGVEQSGVPAESIIVFAETELGQRYVLQIVLNRNFDFLSYDERAEIANWSKLILYTTALLYAG